MMKVSFTHAKVHVDFDYFLRGSVLKSTVNSGCTEVRTHFEVESDETAEKVLAVIKNAKQGCFRRTNSDDRRSAEKHRELEWRVDFVERYYAMRHMGS